MNYLIDSNILLYAKMDSMPEHSIISKWLEESVLNQSNTINICETNFAYALYGFDQTNG